MEASYDVLFKIGRWFLGRDIETRKLFIGEMCDGYYRVKWVSP